MSVQKLNALDSLCPTLVVVGTHCKLNFNKMQNINMLILCFVIFVTFYEQSETRAMEPLDPNIIKDFGYVKYKASNAKLVNGVMNSANAEESIQNLLLYRMVMAAIRLAKAKNGTKYNEKLRIYGEGVEHKFPPFLERILQRIQTYFSVYKYTDTSQPWNQTDLTIITDAIPIPITTTTLNYNTIGTTTTTSTNIAFNPAVSLITNNLFDFKTTTNIMQSTPLSTTTTTTASKIDITPRENSTEFITLND